MIVVDTNIISYFYLHSRYSFLAEQVFKKDSVWSAPLLWRSEFRNVLTFYMKKNIITLSVAISSFEFAEALLKEHEYEVNALQILSLSQSSTCSAYDCEFVTVAKELGLTLVTEDKKVLQSFPELSMSMRQFLETP